MQHGNNGTSLTLQLTMFEVFFLNRSLFLPLVVTVGGCSSARNRITGPLSRVAFELKLLSFHERTLLINFTSKTNLLTI